MCSLTFTRAHTLSGFVRDKSSHKTLPNVNISVLNTDWGTVSDPYGYFTMELEPGDYEIKFSNIGFKSEIVHIQLDKNENDLVINLETVVLELETIEVQGMFSTRLGYESIDAVEGENFKSMQKQSVADALRYLPGIDVQFAHAIDRNVNVSVRGSSDYKPGGYNNRVLLLLDGFPVQIPNSGSPDWSAIPLENVVRVEVDNSPASAQYGHNSMGGVINLITHQNALENYGNYKLSVGSFSTGESGIKLHRVRDSWSYGFSGNVFRSNGHRFNTDSFTNRINTYLKYADHHGRNYHLNILSAYSALGHPGFDISPSYRRSNRASNYIQLHLFYPLAKGMSFSHSIYFNQYKTHYFDRKDTPEEEQDTEQNYQDYSLGLRSDILHTRWARWIMMLGGDIGYDRSKVSVFNPIYSDPEQFTIGSFIQSKYSIGNGWTLGSGIRFDYRQVIPGNSFQNRIYQQVTSKINLMYAFRNKRTFIIAYSQGFRAPSLSELYLQYASSYGLVMQGNPDVQPESVSAWELKYEHPHSEKLFWSLALFHNAYENMIDFVYSLPVRAVNRVGVTGSGMEWQFEWKLNQYITFSNNYTYLNMTDRGGDPILYRSKHSGNGVLSFKNGTNKFSTVLKYWSRQQYEDFLSHDYEVIGDKIHFPIEILPGQSIFNFSYEKEIGSYKGIIVINNIFDKQYSLIQNYPMPGLEWHLTITKTL